MNSKMSIISASILCIVPLFAQTASQDPAVRDRLAKHATLFDYYSSGRRLENTSPNAQGVIDLSQHMLNDYAENPVPLTPQQELALLSKASALVVSGTAVRKDSALNSQHSFVFSDWTIKISQIVKNASGLTLNAGDQIVVVRPGGDIAVNGQRVQATDPSFPEFVAGHQYVMYLPLLADTNSFRAMPGGTFDISGTTPELIADPKQKTSLKSFASSSTPDQLLQLVERSVTQ